MWIDYAALRRGITIERVLELIDYRPASRHGEQLRGPCPFHSAEHAPLRCFSVHLARGLFRCFHCHAQGNQLDLWAQLHQLSLHQAAIDLCRRAGVDVPLLHSPHATP
jgi:DNA primase